MVGLGLIGLLVVQMAKAAGCKVVGIDVDPGRVELARVLGADAALLGGGEDVPDAVRAFTGSRGVDAAVVAAAASSSDPVVLAAELCRDRGRVVVIGAVGMDVPRSLFYEKELSLRVSRSYGPGRYDPLYEEAGVELSGRLRPVDREPESARVPRCGGHGQRERGAAYYPSCTDR